MTKPISDLLENRVGISDPYPWISADGKGSLSAFLAGEIEELAEIASIFQPLEYWSVLRGLCRGPLTHFYELTEGKVHLDRGTPVPLVSRPIHGLFHPTPNPSTTLGRGHLLDGLGYELFQHSAGGIAPVVIDYRYRDRLDEVTWTAQEKLPLIGTVHPFLGAQAIDIGEQTKSWFFDVRPQDWDIDTVLGYLRKLATAQIAVLPELSMPVSDALGEALARDPESYPPLVVAGSAHVREPAGNGGKEIRANESCVYLDGDCIGAHRKIHPFVTKHLGGHDLPGNSTEGITKEVKPITVLSGSCTRLAVVICADLNDNQIPYLLEGAGVNLLLVPAMTGGAGAFNGAVCALASRRQAVAVVVNGGLDPKDDRMPFLVLAAVPREEPREQSREYDRRGVRKPHLALLDPNKPLREALEWIEA